MLWKHTDDHSGRVDRARSRRLVISSIVTVGNYEYGFFWYLHLDGSIEFEAKLTGIVHTAGWVSPGARPTRCRWARASSPATTSTSSARGSTSTSTGARTSPSTARRSASRGATATPTARAFRPQRLTYERESHAQR